MSFPIRTGTFCTIVLMVTVQHALKISYLKVANMTKINPFMWKILHHKAFLCFATGG